MMVFSQIRGLFMKNKMMIVLSLVMLFGATHVSAAVHFGVAGATNYGLNGTVTDATTGASIKSNIGYGGGLLVDIGMGPSMSLEPGVIFLVARVDTTILGTTVTTNSNILRIPVDVRFGLGHVVSLGVGGYYDNYLTATGSSYGAEGILRFMFGGGSSKMFFDTRFNYELKAGSSNSKELYALLGIMFGSK